MRSAEMLLLAMVVTAPVQAQAQQVEREPLREETLRAALTFFEVDAAAPLDAHVVSRDEALGFRREKIVFSGARGERVPAYLSLPKVSGAAFVVFLQHAGAFSKEVWWDSGGFHNGEALTRRLLNAGVAVAALDAYGHGERSSELDYVPIRTLWFEQKRWPLIRDAWIQTTIDHRRFLQYLEERREVDTTRVGTVGLSMGGITSLYLAAVEPRVQVVVAGLSALAEAWLYPLTAVNLAPAFSRARVLLLAGRNDPLIPPSATDMLAAALPAPSRRVRMWESGHELPAEYVDETTEWVIEGVRR